MIHPDRRFGPHPERGLAISLAKKGLAQIKGRIHPDRVLTGAEKNARHRAKHPRTVEFRREEHANYQRAFIAAKTQQYEKQKGLCTLCHTSLPELEKCHWDHDHNTGKMRDVLHRRCNIALGYIEDELYPLALDYLEMHTHDAD
jgi:hypothetical protein